MDIIYNNKVLYVNINDEINFNLIKTLHNRINAIISTYHIANVEINILNNTHYDKILLYDVIEDIHNKYKTIFKIK